jgi:hypothetical protein
MSGGSGHISGDHTRKATSSHVDQSLKRSHDSKSSENRPDSLPPIHQGNSKQHLGQTTSGGSGHISGDHTRKATSSHADQSLKRSHDSKSSENRPDTYSRHDRSDRKLKDQSYSQPTTDVQSSGQTVQRSETGKKNSSMKPMVQPVRLNQGKLLPSCSDNLKIPPKEEKHQQTNLLPNGALLNSAKLTVPTIPRNRSVPLSQNAGSSQTHQSGSDRIRPSASDLDQAHGAPRTHSGYPTGDYTRTVRYTTKGEYYDNYGGDQDIGQASGVDAGDNYGLEPRRRTRASAKMKPGESEYSLHVLIYNEGTENTCCRYSAVTNAMNAFNTTLSSIAGHWALFLGNSRGAGTRIDISFPNRSRISNDWTNVWTFNDQPEVEFYSNYNILYSRHRPTPHHVAETVSPQAVRNAADRAIQGFTYNATTNNCQTFVFNTLRILVQDGHITQLEYNDVHGRISNRFAPAHY